MPRFSKDFTGKAGSEAGGINPEALGAIARPYALRTINGSG
ncbi:hypothetical protein [Thermoleptolyngbya sp.]